jgi:DNA-directed RNA polymerase specialized sigma24 family protein
MYSFEELYKNRGDYVYFLCQRLEDNEERIELLYLDAWRRMRRDLLQLSGMSEEKWLCQKLVDSHRQMNRRNPRHDESELDCGLMSGLMSLGLEYRWALVLKECVGFSYGELGEVLGIPEATVRTRLARARALLRRHLEEEAL